MFYHLRRYGSFKEAFARFYLGELLLALEYLHEFGIVHRSIRPESVLFNPAGHVRLVGFDYAKKVEDRTFTFCGAPDYLAPVRVANRSIHNFPDFLKGDFLCAIALYMCDASQEQLTAKGYGKAVDFWAFGVLCFELIMGYPPFYDKSP